MIKSKISHDMPISGGMNYYLIQIKLGHAGDMGARTCCPMWLPLNLYLIQIKTRERWRGVVAQGIVKSYPLLTNKKNRADLRRQALTPKNQKLSNVFAYTNIGKIIDIRKLKSNNLVSLISLVGLLRTIIIRFK